MAEELGITFITGSWAFGRSESVKISTGESLIDPFIMFHAHNVDMDTGKIEQQEMLLQIIIPRENWEAFVKTTACEFFSDLKEEMRKNE